MHGAEFRRAPWCAPPPFASLFAPLPPMNIHEYQAKQLLAKFGVPVPKGIPVKTPDEARKAFADLGSPLAGENQPVN